MLEESLQKNPLNYLLEQIEILQDFLINFDTDIPNPALKLGLDVVLSLHKAYKFDYTPLPCNIHQWNYELLHALQFFYDQLIIAFHESINNSATMDPRFEESATMACCGFLSEMIKNFSVYDPYIEP